MNAREKLSKSMNVSLREIGRARISFNGDPRPPRGMPGMSRARALAIVVVLAACAARGALAADVVDPLNKREPARPGFLPGSPPEPFALPPVERPGKPPLADSTGARFVERIVIRGNKAIATAELDAIAAPYRGRRVSAAEIEELRQALTRHYIDRGYISSGALLEPEAPAGTLAFWTCPGRTEPMPPASITGL